MEDSRKNFNVFDLDKDASNQAYINKLAELDIFIGGKFCNFVFNFIFHHQREN